MLGVHASVTTLVLAYTGFVCYKLNLSSAKSPLNTKGLQHTDIAKKLFFPKLYSLFHFRMAKSAICYSLKLSQDCLTTLYLWVVRVGNGHQTKWTPIVCMANSAPSVLHFSAFLWPSTTIWSIYCIARISWGPNFMNCSTYESLHSHLLINLASHRMAW